MPSHRDGLQFALFVKNIFSKIVDVKPDELRALWLAFVFNFVVLAGYYILRPIREEIGATSGVETLPWMYTATLIGMLIANALFWVFMTDLCTGEQGKLLFGFIAVGGSLGAILGPLVPSFLVERFS